MKVIKHWTIKIFFITLFISAGVSVAAGIFYFQPVAACIRGDIVGADCDWRTVRYCWSSLRKLRPGPFIAMSAKKYKAHYALKMLKNADVVSIFAMT